MEKNDNFIRLFLNAFFLLASIRFSLLLYILFYWRFENAPYLIYTRAKNSPLIFYKAITIITLFIIISCTTQSFTQKDGENNKNNNRPLLNCKFGKLTLSFFLFQNFVIQYLFKLKNIVQMFFLAMSTFICREK